jgi:hypothetical protein
VQAKSYPQIDGWLDIVPVDWAARTIVHLSRRNKPEGRDYHLVAAQPLAMSDFLDRMSAKFSIAAANLGDWSQHLEGSAIAPLLPLMRIPEVAAHLFGSGPSGRLSRKNIAKDLEGSGIESIVVETDLVDRYLGYFAKSGFLD